MSTAPHNRRTAGVPAGLFIAALLTSACAADDESTASGSQDEDAGQLSEEDLAELDPADEIVIECTDPEMLDELEDHDPAGWPQEWEDGDPLPDPECHPDYIEIEAWEHREEFSAHREGIETSTPVRSPDMTDQDMYEILWEASEARDSWRP